MGKCAPTTNNTAETNSGLYVGAYPFIQYVKTGKGNTFFNNFYVSGDLDFLLFEGYTLKLTFADYFH